ncbi:Cytochrome P450 4C1 [Eumeta japonica]|uniref:Cytochrome P450 4C1 n=1 Tax=Eumeta variegata TaxID=151549 RepID=A0A4C2A433_EUMVA|nr:Cytochrome P450 4C1 [Eumeta japonica]
MGTKLDEDSSSAAVEYKSAVLAMGAALLGRLSRVWLHPDFIFNLSHRGKVFRKQVEIVHAFPDNVIKERKKNFTPYEEEGDESKEVYGKKRLAMMDLLSSCRTKRRNRLRRDQRRSEYFYVRVQCHQVLRSHPAYLSQYVVQHCHVGHDTTAMAIMFALMLLAEHPEAQNKICEECVAVCGQDRPVSSADLAEMKYLDCVVKETLRLYPSVPFIAREITEDFTIGDLKVPAGSEVAIHIYNLHRRPDFYEDPSEFKPERFLRGSPNKHAYCYVPFSAGPRNCIVSFDHTAHSIDVFVVHSDGRATITKFVIDIDTTVLELCKPVTNSRLAWQYHKPIAVEVLRLLIKKLRQVGQRFAMQEMKCVLSEICRAFTLGPVEGSRPHQVALVADLVLRSATPIYVEYTPRRANI